jgi:peptidoglycan hydrolase-like protein with peptidoglycan-binding domain
LRPGSRGAAVLELQQQLRRAGFLRGDPDGIYGRVTRGAVLALQRKNGIEADGVAGSETRLLLLRLGGEAVPSLKESP